MMYVFDGLMFQQFSHLRQIYPTRDNKKYLDLDYVCLQVCPLCWI